MIFLCLKEQKKCSSAAICWLFWSDSHNTVYITINLHTVFSWWWINVSILIPDLQENCIWIHNWYISTIYKTLGVFVWHLFYISVGTETVTQSQVHGKTSEERRSLYSKVWKYKVVQCVALDQVKRWTSSLWFPLEGSDQAGLFSFLGLCIFISTTKQN